MVSGSARAVRGTPRTLLGPREGRQWQLIHTGPQPLSQSPWGFRIQNLFGFQKNKEMKVPQIMQRPQWGLGQYLQWHSHSCMASSEVTQRVKYEL